MEKKIDLMEEKRLLFATNFPELYKVFKAIIHNLGSAREKSFFIRLIKLWEIINAGIKDKDTKRYITKVFNPSGVKLHPLFEAFKLSLFSKNPCLFHSYVHELERALCNQNIIFHSENHKRQKVRELTNKTNFWNIYFEFEIANTFASAGHKVKICHHNESHDLRVFVDGKYFNAEVTAIRYENRPDKKQICQKIRRTLQKKAEQVPKSGINIIVLAVPLDSNVMPFDICDSLYDPPDKVAIPQGLKRGIFKVKKILIFDKYEKLKHISGVLEWSHKGVAVNKFGFTARRIFPWVKNDLPVKIKKAFAKIAS